MPEFAANLSQTFTALPFLERFGAAAQAGFTRVACNHPYAFPPAELKRRLVHHGLRLVLFNVPSGDWSHGDRGLAADPGRVDEFRTMLPRALEYALALGVDQVNCLAGNRLPRYGWARQVETLVANLRHAARRLAPFGIRLLVEPVPSSRLPGFFLDRVDQALALLDRVGEPNVFLDLHLDPAGSGEEDPLEVVGRCLPAIGHLQLDGRPGPADGPALFLGLDQAGYRGSVGLEVVPDLAAWGAATWPRAAGAEPW
jgi:hydroxypyruvate isomerase